MLKKIPLAAVRRKYNATSKIWNEEDYWHFHLYRNYETILKSIENVFPKGPLLNFGSADEDYKLKNSPMIYLDAAEKSLPACKLAVCGDAHYMPFESNSFQSAIAIGSVLNYCAPAEIFSEVARVLDEGGIFVFDFEQSEGFEHFGSNAFGKDAHIFKTDFNDIDETIWVFRAAHIENLLAAGGFKILKKINIHAISSLVWRLTESNKLTAAVCKFDRISCAVPVLRKWSSNVFVIAQKIASKQA